jgi:hypothetical protein
LTPAGHQRVDVILDELADAVSDHAWLVRFAKARETEADTGSTEISDDREPALMLSEQELGVLTAGFRTIRDQEPLDDVADWANAVLALLKDDQPSRDKPRPPDRP